MRRTVSLPPSIIIERLPEDARIFVLGCGDCATREQFGGAAQCRELAERLAEAGVPVSGWAVPPEGEGTCNPGVARRLIEANASALANTTAIVLMACAQAEPALAQVTELPLVSGVRTIVGVETGGGALTVEECHLCARCVARASGGLCPHSFCPKGLMNGPCGGAQGGRCEVYPGRPCVWDLIYRRLQAAGKLDLLDGYQAPVSFRLPADD
jgi:hypothetical protein